MKKVLSFVLILAMILGSFAFTFAAEEEEMPAASDFSDYASITQKEAVDVLVATEIINGMPDGSFDYAGDVTRAQMAKMIAILMNGEDVGEYYAVDNVYSDMSGASWAKGYVAWCASKGIIAGDGNGMFRPNDKVTGVEAAKMMLVALGYDPKIEGFEGTNWATNVLAVAKDPIDGEEGGDTNLFDEIDTKPAQAFTREDAARLIFNAMMNVTVTYGKKDTIVIGDVTITSTSQAEARTGEYAYLFMDAFNGDLKLGEGAANWKDDFGRPAHKWFFEKEEIGTYADEADYTFVVDDNETLEEQLKNFDKTTFKTKGSDYTVSKVIANGDIIFGNADTEDNDFDTAYACLVWKGEEVELFETSTADEYIAIVKGYYAGQITEVDTDVDEDDDFDAYVTLTVMADDEAGETTGEETVETNSDDFAGFDLATYKEDAIVAVAMNKAGDIIDSYLLKAEATGDWTRTYSTKMTVDGKSYNYLYGYAECVYNDGASTDDEVELYLINGYVAAIVQVEADSSTSYGILFSTWAANGKTWNNKVEILTADGKVVEYTVASEEDAFVVDPEATPVVNIPVGAMVAYTVNDSGKAEYVAEGATTYLITEYNGADTKNEKLGGKKISEDIVVFSFDEGEAADDADNYEILGFSDVKSAEGIKGFGIYDYDSKELVALLATDGVSVSDSVLAIYAGRDVESPTDEYLVVTALVNGKSEDYDTVKADKLGVENWSELTPGEVVKLKFNEDGEITKIVETTPAYLDDFTDDFDSGVDYAIFRADGDSDLYPIYEVTEKDGGDLTLGEYTVNVDGAKVYICDSGAYDADNYKISKIRQGSYVRVYQFSEDSDNWDVVVVFTGTPQ